MIRLIEIKLSSDSILTIPEAYSAINALYPNIEEITIERNNGDVDAVRVFDDDANEYDIRDAIHFALNNAACAKLADQ